MRTRPQAAVVVTGAASGLGRACALALDTAGYRVFATVRQEKAAESLRQAASAHLAPVMMDVTDEGAVAAAAAAVAEAIGGTGLAGLVNNAGGGVPGPIELIAPDDLRRQFEINVFGQVRVTQAFLPLLRQARGRIIHIGSVGGQITIPFGGALCAFEVCPGSHQRRAAEGAVPVGHARRPGRPGRHRDPGR
jgi:NAD(P)-dependent dehydrogenase (short-subunit alcohol dehydrogenase family)